MRRHSVQIDGDADHPWLRPLAESLLDQLSKEPPCSGYDEPLQLSLVLTDDPSIQELNERWRGKNAATDVLSFPLDEGPLLGDVVISMDTAGRRVSEPEWSLEDEVLFLLIHGVLHLLGHDHMEPEDRTTMEATEQRLWTAMGRSGTLRSD